MNNKERVLQLIDDIPDQKLVFIVNLLESLRAYAGETLPPDERDPQMTDDTQKETDESAYRIREVAKDLEIVL